jgi:hypothetical protein
MAQESIDVLSSQVFEQKNKATKIGSLSKTQQRQTASLMIENLENVRGILAAAAPAFKNSESESVV